MNKNEAVEFSQKFIESEFPQCEAAFLCGSAARGEMKSTSDLDLLIFDSKVKPYRQGVIWNSQPIEFFVLNDERLEERNQQDKDLGRPIIANMLHQGVSLKDDGKNEARKNNVAEYLKQGPNPLSEAFIEASRYFVFDLLDDFEDSVNRQTAIETMHRLSVDFAEMVLRYNGKWIGRGKALTKELYNFDPQFAEEYYSALDVFYKEDDKEPFINLVKAFYEQLGGPLFAGFHRYF
ncbi:nucleotidyltransferase domain-containing protein [Bacillus carboniphilus]|uniref:Nucleotidyltransferase domain-containing protein n=1 Tax=Bacillus carboniphilus TaxID=86663 RepID=A0ABP3G3F8_9BACI